MRAAWLDEIAGFSAALVNVDIEVFLDKPGEGRDPTPGRTLALYCVRELERVVDRDGLLRAPASEEPPYWALPWIGARAIAAYVLSHPIPSGSRVLDLGCGLGLSGIAAGLGGSKVVFADSVDEALAFARANAGFHRIARYETRTLDFTRDRLGTAFDLILAADIVYDPAAYGALVDFLDVHLAAHGAILLTESLRADARHVIDQLAERGIEGRKDAIWVYEDGRPERTWLHVLGRITPRA